MFFKTGVLKIFKHFTVKHLCRGLFFISVIKNRVQHRFFSVKFEKFLWTPSVFCKDYVNMRILMLILAEPTWLQLIYFLNSISFWFVECFFSIDGALKLAYYFRVLQNLLFFLPHKSAIMENTRHRINQFQLFYFDKSNQIKFSREIIRYQGYFFKIALGTRVWERHLRDLFETSQKRLLFWGVFKTSQIHVKKMSFVWRLWNVSKTSLASICDFSKIHHKNDFEWFP